MENNKNEAINALIGGLMSEKENFFNRIHAIIDAHKGMSERRETVDLGSGKCMCKDAKTPFNYNHNYHCCCGMGGHMGMGGGHKQMISQQISDLTEALNQINTTLKQYLTIK